MNNPNNSNEGEKMRKLIEISRKAGDDKFKPENPDSDNFDSDNPIDSEPDNPDSDESNDEDDESFHYLRDNRHTSLQKTNAFIREAITSRY